MSQSHEPLASLLSIWLFAGFMPLVHYSVCEPKWSIGQRVLVGLLAGPTTWFFGILWLIWRVVRPAWNRLWSAAGKIGPRQ